MAHFRCHNLYDIYGLFIGASFKDYFWHFRKKKKKDKEKELSKMYENIASHASTSETTDGETRKIQVDKRTKAEIAFEQAKEKKVIHL